MIENYKKDVLGIVHQIKYDKIIYNINYIHDRYDSYGELNRRMSCLRLGNIIGTIGRYPTSILDVGYGNGDFLGLCSEAINDCYGNDISGYPIPKNCKYIGDICSTEFDVITFFDVLEHFDDINIISKLNCNYVVISVPWCHYFSDEWFLNWKHRRPNEHLHHFNDKSLNRFMNIHNYDHLSITNVEDIVRKSNNENNNILTGIFKKRK